MVLAHQYLGQLEPKPQEALGANTAIKFAGGVSAKDARALAPMMYCSPELIEAQPKGNFAAHVRGQTTGAVPLRFPLGFMEQHPQMEKSERHALRQQMRARYAVHYSELGAFEQQNEGDDDQPASESDMPKRASGHIETDAADRW